MSHNALQQGSRKEENIWTLYEKYALLDFLTHGSYCNIIAVIKGSARSFTKLLWWQHARYTARKSVRSLLRNITGIFPSWRELNGLNCSPGGVSRAGEYLVIIQETAAGQITWRQTEGSRWDEDSCVLPTHTVYFLSPTVSSSTCFTLAVLPNATLKGLMSPPEIKLGMLCVSHYPYGPRQPGHAGSTATEQKSDWIQLFNMETE